jgi:archaellum component FlaC
MSDVYDGLCLRTFRRHNAGTSNFTNPSLVSPTTPTLANPTRGFAPTNTPLTTVTEVADVQEAQSADEQSLEPEAIKEKPLVHDISRISLRRLQPRLTVSQPGDRYEQEADSVANQIMRMARPEPKINFGGMNSQDIMQRKCAACEEEVQTKPANDGSVHTEANIESQLNSSKGGGSPLSAEVRDFMEPRFSNKFDNVRVHTDSNAVQMSRSLGAQAFTHGSDVYFGAGKSPGNNELTAHELTHVVQQTGAVQKKSDVSPAPTHIQRAPDAMPPKKGTTKIDKKDTTITASGKNITEAITNLTSQGKGEAGSVTCAPEKDVKTYQADDKSDEIVYEADVSVTETKAMPVWTELDKQCEPVKKEWARFYSALDTHENGHISIDEKAFKDLHKKLLGKKPSEADNIFNNTYTKANTDNATYDTTTKHGLTQGTGVTPVQCAPEKVSQNEDESNAQIEVQALQVEAKTLQRKPASDFLSETSVRVGDGDHTVTVLQRGDQIELIMCSVCQKMSNSLDVILKDIPITDQSKNMRRRFEQLQNKIKDLEEQLSRRTISQGEATHQIKNIASDLDKICKNYGITDASNFAKIQKQVQEFAELSIRSKVDTPIAAEITISLMEDLYGGATSRKSLKQFVSALENGMASGARSAAGIKELRGSVRGFTHELKILGAGERLLGKNEGGRIVFKELSEHL